jgi:hypothetical protein
LTQRFFPQVCISFSLFFYFSAISKPRSETFTVTSFIFIVSGSILVSFHFRFRLLFCFFDSTGLWKLKCEYFVL